MTSSALQDIVALLGCPAAGNPAQYLFERAIEAAELDWRFVTCDVAECDAAAAIEGVKALGFRGCLLSGPLRGAALAHVASASPSAAFAGAVGLIERRADGLAGHMTDGRGIVEAIRGHVDPAGKAALVIGADATGRAAALELALAGATTVMVADADSSAADALVAALSAVHATETAVLDGTGAIAVPERIGIVVIGPAVAATCRLDDLRPDLVVAEVALAGQPSLAVVRAAELGCCVVDGMEIHATRTAIDFQAISGIEPDVEMLREALEEFLS